MTRFLLGVGVAGVIMYVSSINNIDDPRFVGLALMLATGGVILSGVIWCAQNVEFKIREKPMCDCQRRELERSRPAMRMMP